jgi:hypothetical protein
MAIRPILGTVTGLIDRKRGRFPPSAHRDYGLARTAGIQ